MVNGERRQLRLLVALKGVLWTLLHHESRLLWLLYRRHFDAVEFVIFVVMLFIHQLVLLRLSSELPT